MNSPAEAFSDVIGPVPWSMMMGTASQVTICQAMPMPRSTSWPMKPARSSSDCRISPTVPVSSDHRASGPSREAAPLSELDTVGLPPRNRSRAPATRAPVKKVTMNVMSR